MESIMEKSIEDQIFLFYFNINPEKYAKPERYDVGSYSNSTSEYVLYLLSFNIFNEDKSQINLYSEIRIQS